MDDWMINVVIWGVLAGFIPVVLSHGGYPVTLNSIMYLILGYVVQSSTKAVYTSVAFCCVFLGVWNDTVRRLPPGHPVPLLMVPNPVNPSPEEFLLAQCGGVLMGFIGCFFVYLQAEEHIRHSAVQSTTLQMATEVARYIETYDTDSIEVVLAEYRPASVSDEQLLQAFHRIKVNLESIGHIFRIFCSSTTKTSNVPPPPKRHPRQPRLVAASRKTPLRAA